MVKVKLIIPAAINNFANSAFAYQASITLATSALDNCNDAYNAVASLIINTISDVQMYYVRSVNEDPVATRKRLKDKFERKTKFATATPFSAHRDKNCGSNNRTVRKGGGDLLAIKSSCFR